MFGTLAKRAVRPRLAQRLMVQQPSMARMMSATPLESDYSSKDNYINSTRVHNEADPTNRTFTYLTLGTARFMYASIARVAVVKFVTSMSASADVLALSKIEVDLSKINEGMSTTVKWRGKPVFIRNRTPDEIASAVADDGKEMRDPETDSERFGADPRWVVVLGVCTHLGCVPINKAGEYMGWFCPCHGSHYDTSGRIRKGPAPLNLEIPEYSFIDDNTVLIG